MTAPPEAVSVCRAVAEHIDRQVVARIRDCYSVDDELKMLRLAPSPESAAYNDHVEECRAWGRACKAELAALFQ